MVTFGDREDTGKVDTISDVMELLRDSTINKKTTHLLKHKAKIMLSFYE